MTKKIPAATKNSPARKSRASEAGYQSGSAYNRSLIEASPDPLVTISPDGTITDVNAATIRITGYTGEELIGTRFSGYFTEPGKAEEGYATVFREGIVRDYPLEIRHRDGGITPVLYNASVYRDESGEVAGVFAAARDITELKRAEEELAKAGAYNRSLLEAALDPLVTISAAGKIMDVNAATVKITGYTRKQLIGTDFSDYFSDAAAAKAGYNAAFQKGSVRDYELKVRHKSGKEIPVLYNASIYRDGAGNVAGVFAAARDISERRKAEEERAQLAAIVESSDDAIISKSLDGIILTWNAGARKMYGYTASEVVGRNISLLIPPGLEDDLEYILKKVRKGTPVNHFESHRKRKDGAILPVSITISPITGPEGNLIGAATIARDISLQKKAEELARRAERYNRSLIDASLDPLVTINADGTISDVNAATVGITGLSREELIGTDFSRYFTDPHAARAGYETVFRQGSVRDYELTLRHRDGTVTPVLYNASVYSDETGAVAGVFAAARDITKMKKAEENAIAERKQLFDVLETLPVYVCLLNADYRMPFANRYFRETFAEPLGRRCHDFLFNLDKPCEGCETYTVMKTRAPHHWYWTGPNGRDYDIYDFPFTDTDGSFMILEMGIDITERNRAEKALRIAGAYNRSLLEASLDPLVTISPEGKLTDVNEAAVKATGLSRDALIGTDFSGYFTRPDLAQAGYQQVFRDGEVKDYALELRHRDGRITPVLYNAAVYRNEAGEVTGVFAAARDVTDLRKAEDGLRRLNSALEERVKERTAELREANRNLHEEVGVRKRAQEELAKSNDDLNAINEELTATQEELRETNDELLKNEKSLIEKNDDLNAINEELTATQEELRETNDELLKNEKSLIEKNDDLNAINEELTATQEELQQNNEELMKAELDLRETGQYLDNLINYANAPIIVWNPHFRITRFNRAFERLTGRTAESVVGRPLEILFPVDRKDSLMATIRSTLSGEQWESVEIPILNADGGIRIVLWNSATLFRPDGKSVMSVIAQGQDITDRKKIERTLAERNDELNAINEELTATQEELRQNLEELAKSEIVVRETGQYLENLINYANAPIIVWDSHFVITRFNRAFEKLTGRKAGDVMGKTIEILFPDDQREEQMAGILRTLGGERWDSVEIPILHSSGEVRTVLWNSATLYASDRKTVMSVIAQGQDITARKSIEADLVRKNEELTSIQEELRQNVDELAASERLLRTNEAELKETLAEKDVLLAEIHHRVKNNLTALISLLSLEGGYEETPEGQTLKKDLQNRARSMALIHETLYKTKKYAEVDMGVYLKNLINQMQASFPISVPVRTVVDADDVILDIPRATPCGLIINELVTNSFKYAFPPSFDCKAERNAPPTISIALSRENAMYTLIYRDNGIGIPEEFDVKSAQSLGLKLVNFLARHQMRADVSVEKREGTAFTFTFRESVKGKP